MGSVVDFVFIFLALYTASVDCRNCEVDSFAVQANFNITKYLGTWYEMKSIPNTFFLPEEWYRDYKHIYGEDKNGNITITISGRDPSNRCMYYNAFLLKTNSPAKLVKTEPRGNPTNYWVIDTDYNKYSVVYGCEKKNETDGTCIDPLAWVWSRQQTLNEQLMKKANSKLLSLCLNLTAFGETEQKEDCPTDKASNLLSPLLYLNCLILCVVHRVITK